MRALLAGLRDYVEGPDPLASIAGAIGVLIAVNLPFCALFLYSIGVAPWSAWTVLVAVPFFAAVPAVARRHSLAGRAMLPIVGVANVVLWVKLFGAATAAELFLFPCVLLGVTLFRQGERIMTAVVLALVLVAYALIDRHLVPAQALGADTLTAMTTINAISVALLIAVNGMMLAALLSERRD